MKNTSWENISDTYIKNVGKDGSFYHKNVVIPNTLRLLNISSKDSLLDLACGQGILERHIPQETSYMGIEISESLLKYAEENKTSANHSFLQSDISTNLSLESKYSHAALILAIQNIKNISEVFKNAADALKPKGLFCIVLNHPFFRIPKYSKWLIDNDSEVQGRAVTKYLNSREIALLANPSKGEKSDKVFTYHRSLQEYSKTLANCGFCILKIEEWISNKTSEGKHANMENEARKEFPLFYGIFMSKSLTKTKIRLIIAAFVVIFIAGIVSTVFSFSKFIHNKKWVPPVQEKADSYKLSPQMKPQEALLQILEESKKDGNSAAINLFYDAETLESARALTKANDLSKIELGTPFYDNGENDIRVSFLHTDGTIQKKIFGLAVDNETWKLSSIKDIRLLTKNDYTGNVASVDELKIKIPSAWKSKQDTQGFYFSNVEITSTDPTKILANQYLFHISLLGNTNNQNIGDLINCNKVPSSTCSLVEIQDKEYTLIEATLTESSLKLVILPLDIKGKGYIVSYYHRLGLDNKNRELLESILTSLSF